MSVLLKEIVAKLDELLKPWLADDWPAAKNGLQVECAAPISRVAAAVDATLPVIRKAVERRANLLIVHHGLFWTGIEPLTGAAYQKIRLCVQNNLAIYSSHLPLDAHEEHGNGVGFLTALGLQSGEACFECKGWKIGRLVDTDLTTIELLERCEKATGEIPNLVHMARARVGRLAVVTGGGGDMIRDAARLGVHTFLSGEGAHWTAGLAEELGINLIYAGHYATETFGVRSLAAWCSRHWGIDWEFIPHPSGL